MATGLPISKRYITNKQKPLKFRKDGTFRILHLTDIHEVSPEMDDDENAQIPKDKSKETLNVIEKCIDSANPDLIVFGGDNISGFWQEFTYDYMVETIRKIVKPIADRNIPLAIVFGNHDSEAENKLEFLHRETQIGIYAEYENFRGTMNDEDVFGCGNYNLPIFSSNSNKIEWNIWCMDSNDYIRDEKFNQVKDAGYGYVHNDQIAWYEKTAEKLKQQNDGEIVPSILFQHIPVLAEYELLELTDNETDLKHGEKFYKPKDGAIIDGKICEAPCPPEKHNEQFESWKRTGDIIAAFFGHDHINTFTAEVDGIKLIQTVAAGYHTYGKERGGRLIVLKEGCKDFDTKVIEIERITSSTF